MPTDSTIDRKRAESILGQLITPGQWEACGGVIRTANREGLGFVIGGGLAFSAYTGNGRNTKDMDFYVLPRDQERMKAVMADHGFTEYTVVPYDPTWSYRGERQGYILDLLWRMLNNRSEVDDHWILRGLVVPLHGVPLKLIPKEELLWSKLYIMHRDRCDWPDILGLLLAQSHAMDWEHLLGRLGEDAAVLGSIMSLFRWLCPGPAWRLPPSLWERVGLSPISLPTARSVDNHRVSLFSAEQWFTGIEV